MELAAKIARRIDKMIKNDAIVDETVLNYLHRLQDMDVNLEILTKTGVGIIINKLRKQSKNEEITSLGKQLVKQWKKLVSGPEPGGKRSPPASGDDSSQHGPSEAKRIRRPQPDDDESHQDSDAGTGSPARVHKPVVHHSSSHRFLETTDGVRLKARKMIQDALESQPNPDGGFTPEFLASSIENEIFKIFNNTCPQYRHRVRTRVMNLRDASNPSLRLSVLDGTIAPAKLASMTSEEMASKDMNELRKKYNRETIDDHQMAVTGGTESDILKCGKCKQNKCTYNQVQTRSADEPMTTFVFCNNCGHRWKFC